MSPQEIKLQSQRNDRTRAFLELPRDQALQKHPELQSAYLTHDRLSQTLTRSQPLTSDTQRDVASLIRNTIAKDLVRGTAPDATPKLQEAVKVQVAMRNLHTVSDAVERDPGRAPQLRNDERELLVKHAEVAMTIDKPGRVRAIGPYASPERFEAHTVSALLARTDFPTPRNPFQHPDLARAYSSEQSYTRYRHERSEREAQGAREPALVGGGLER